MIYANDQWLLLPVKDLYDSLIMLASILQAREMYKEQKEELDAFKKEYGDFMSPILLDMDWYDENVTGKVRKAIADLYAHGIDPLRSAEGRYYISNIINSIDTNKAAFYKQRAENAKAYYKNMGELKSKNLYNEDFSRFLKEDPTLWDPNFSGVTSPTAYSDLNSATSHWFDKINRDAYLYTDKDGYDYFGVKPEDLNLVMSSQIPDFINSDYGRYQMELARRQLGSDATGNDIINRLRSNIISANSEMTINPSRKLNPVKQMLLLDYYKQKDAARDFYYQKELYKFQHPDEFDGNGNRVPKNDGAYDSSEGLFNRGLTHSGGADNIQDPGTAVEYGRDNIIARQMETVKMSNKVGDNMAKTVDRVINDFSIEESPENFSRYTGRNSKDGVMKLNSRDIEDLYSANDIVLNMYGITYGSRGVGKNGKAVINRKEATTDRSGISAGDVLQPTKRVITLFNKDHTGQYAINQYWECQVGETDDEGNVISIKPGYHYYKLPSSRQSSSNMPPAQKYSKNDKKFKPNMNPDYRTKGLRNTGSNLVNKQENVPSNIGFLGTYNEEAMFK